jgi:hypothetical protein
MLNQHALTNRQFIIGGIVLFVLMLIINLAFPLDGLLRAVTLVLGALGLVLTIAFLVNSRSKNGEPLPEDEEPAP